MKRAPAKPIRIYIEVIICVMVGMLLRTLGRELPGRFPSFVRSFLYIGLFTYWGISLRRRVMQKETKRLLSSVAGLMVFWIAVRSIKYFLVTDADTLRYLWYLYYLPMLFIPFLSVYVACSLGKDEHYRLPVWSRVFYLPVAALFLLVLTNDPHQLVFVFNNGIMSESDYTYGIGYFAVIGCMVICALTAVVIMTVKCRASRGKKLSVLPLVFIALSLTYGVVYALRISDKSSLLYLLAGDLTVSLCVLFAGTLESCIVAGLIPANTGYGELFRVVSVGIQIIDSENNVRYSSLQAKKLTSGQIENVKRGPLTDGDTIFKSCPISGGWSVWQEDVSALTRVRAELESTRAELAERNELLRDQYRKDAHRYRLEEQNRLYDLVQRETQKQLCEIDALASEFEKTPKDSDERRALLLRISVIATYIKRRKDMVISSDRNKELPVNLLSAALRESVGNLPLGGIRGNLLLPGYGAIVPVRTLLSAFELFEDALELSLETLRYYYVTLSDEDGLSMRLNFETDTDLSPLFPKYPGAEFERDDGWFISMKLPGGEKK